MAIDRSRLRIDPQGAVGQRCKGFRVFFGVTAFCLHLTHPTGPTLHAKFTAPDGTIQA
jgi:hypothetical protein